MGGAACDWGDQFASAAGYRGLPPASPPPPHTAAVASPPRPPDVVIGVGSPENGAPSSLLPPTRRATVDGVASKPPTLASDAVPPPPVSATTTATPQYDWEQALLADLLHGDRHGATGWLAYCRRLARRHGRTAMAVAAAAAAAATLSATLPHARLLGVHVWRYALLAAATPLVWGAADRAVAAALAAADGRVARSTAALLALAGARGPAVRLARAAGLAAAFGAAVADYDGAADGAVQHAALATAAKLLACFAIAAAASLAARVAAAWLAASLYARAHADRVRDALDKEYILWALSQPRGAGARRGHDPPPPPPPPPPVDAPLLATPTPSLTRAPTGAALAALEAHVREHRLASPLADALGAVRPPPASSSSGPPAHVADADDARTLALYLFWHVRGPAVGRGHLEKGDLAAFLGAPTADAAWRLLDPAATGRAPPAAVRDAVTSIHTQRAQLAAALAGARASAKSLEAALAALAHALALLAYCAVFGVDAGRALLTASSALVATAFIFGNTLRGVFESAAFVYGVHAFDVGDVLLVDGVWHQVVGASLLHTRLQRWDGVRLWYPNARLAADPVANVSRSAPRWEGLKVAIDAATPASAIDAVGAAVAAHLRGPTGRGEFTGDHLVVANYAGDPLKFTLCVWWEYAHPAADLGRTSRARHGLYMAVGAALAAAGVGYTLPPFSSGGGWPGGNAGPPPGAGWSPAGPPGAVAAAAVHAGGAALGGAVHPWP